MRDKVTPEWHVYHVFRVTWPL